MHETALDREGIPVLGDCRGPLIVRMTTCSDLPSGVLVRMRGSTGAMYTSFRLEHASVAETGQELPIVHRYSVEERHADWDLHSRARSLAVIQTESPMLQGSTLILHLVPTVRPVAAPGLRAHWVLEQIVRLHEPDGTVISAPLWAVFRNGAVTALTAVQRPAGELSVRALDTSGYPATAESANTPISWEPVQGSTRHRAVAADGRCAVSNAVPVSIDGTPTYFCDFHWHSEFSDGQQPLRQALVNACEHQLLDFAGPSDHIGATGRFRDRFVSDQAAICRDANRPDAFCTLPAVEVSLRHGHVHVVAESFSVLEEILARFPDTLARAVGDQPSRFPWKALLSACPPGQALVAPCHPNMDSGTIVRPEDGRVYWYSCTWPAVADRTVMRLVEMANSDASQETEHLESDWPLAGGGTGGSVRTALARGYRVGFYGSSDNHEGWPGRGGLTAVQSAELDTGSIFRALHARRCYATTGARIVADATLNGHPIGSEVRLDPDARRVLSVKIAGTAPIDTVQVISEGAVVADLAVDLDEWEFEGEWIDARPGRHLENVYYYVRARQRDGHCLWLSPFWVDLPE